MELNRPQLSVSTRSLLPLIKPDERISRIRLSGPLHRMAFGGLQRFFHAACSGSGQRPYRPRNNSLG